MKTRSIRAKRPFSPLEAPAKIEDLRPRDQRGQSPFHDTSWLIEISSGEFLPVCSFASRDGAVVILFLERVSLCRPEDASNSTFWAPWRAKAMRFVSFAAGIPDMVGALQPCVLWKIREGQVLDQTLASPIALVKMIDFPGIGSAVLATIRDLLEAERALSVRKAEVDRARHRVARFYVPHRERPGRGARGGRR